MEAANKYILSVVPVSHGGSFGKVPCAEGSVLMVHGFKSPSSLFYSIGRIGIKFGMEDGTLDFLLSV